MRSAHLPAYFLILAATVILWGCEQKNEPQASADRESSNVAAVPGRPVAPPNELSQVPSGQDTNITQQLETPDTDDTLPGRPEQPNAPAVLPDQNLPVQPTPRPMPDGKLPMQPQPPPAPHGNLPQQPEPPPAE